MVESRLDQPSRLLAFQPSLRKDLFVFVVLEGFDGHFVGYCCEEFWVGCRQRRRKELRSFTIAYANTRNQILIKAPALVGFISMRWSRSSFDITIDGVAYVASGLDQAIYASTSTPFYPDDVWVQTHRDTKHRISALRSPNQHSILTHLSLSCLCLHPYPQNF